MVALTGANGLLGSFIVRKLLAEGKAVMAIKRAESDTSLLKDVAEKISWRDADITDPVSLNEALQGADLVIHAAALVSFNPGDSKKIFEVNVQGTKNVIEACFANKVSRLLHISSVAALGRQKDQQIVGEENKWVNSSLNSAYAESKYLAELEIFRAQEEGLSTVMINPSVILAPADWDRSSAQLFKYSWQERSPFYIDGTLHVVDVRDVASIAYQLLYLPDQHGRFIVSAGHVKFIDFFKTVAQKFNKKAPTVKLNKKFLKVLVWLEMFRSFITRSEPLLTPETARLAGSDFSYDNQKIRKVLNFEFQSIDKTLKWCCENYMAKINGKK